MTYVNGSWSKFCFVDFPIIKVMVRDGYTCVITGYKDVSHPARDETYPDYNLQAAHILRRSIGNYDSDHTSTSVGHLSVLVSFIAYQTSFTFPSSLGLRLQHSTYSEILPAFRSRNSKICIAALMTRPMAWFFNPTHTSHLTNLNGAWRKHRSVFLRLSSYR